MASEIQIFDGSQYRKASEVHIFDGSQYRKASEVHVFDGSAWRKVFAGGGTVTVSSQNIEHANSGGAIAGIRFNADGTVDKRTGSTYTQISASTNWIIPNTGASSAYQIRITNVSWYNGSSFYTSAAGIGTWINLGSNREWSIMETRTNYTKYVDFTVEIRDASEVVQDTGAIRLVAKAWT